MDARQRYLAAMLSSDGQSGKMGEADADAVNTGTDLATHAAVSRLGEAFPDPVPVLAALLLNQSASLSAWPWCGCARPDASQRPVVDIQDAKLCSPK